MFCKKCGSKIEDDMSFCPECGAKVVEEDNANIELRKISGGEGSVKPEPLQQERKPKKPVNKKLIGIIAGIARV